MRNLIVIALALFALGAVTCLAEAPAGKAAGRPQWEYQTLTRDKLAELGKSDVTAGLNKVGDDGWELVAVTPAQEARPGTPSRPAEFYFKRPKGQAPREERRSAPTQEAAPEAFQIVRLKYAPAPELGKTLQSVFGRGALVIVAEPRTNALILRGPMKQIEEVLMLVRDLDVEGEQRKDRRTP
jgi:Bacterial type II/III secretion system short domain